MNSRALWAAIATLACLISPASAASLAKAIELMQAGDLAAEREFLEVTRGSSDDPAARQEVAQAYFYLGALQQLEIKDPDAARSALVAAQKYYESALSIEPTMGGALNNLARAQWQLGDAKTALTTIDRALALKDGREAVYLATRADIAEKTGDAPLARAAAQQAVLVAPQDKARLASFARLSSADPVLLVKTVDQLLANGESLAAQTIILGALANSAAPRAVLLERLADALAAQSYEPAKFGETEAGLALAKLKGDAALKAPAEQLLAVHLSPTSNPWQYQWWVRGYSEYSRTAADSPAPRFQRLVSSLGRWYRERGTRADLERAIPYVELALRLNGDSIDPRAILDLASVYGAAGNRDKLKSMSDQYIQPLFYGKQMAYRDAERTHDYRKIYDFHMALGTIYGYLGKWKCSSANDPTCAIFQLEHARTAAENINRGKSPKSPEYIVMPAASVQLLAKAYEETGKPDDSLAVRVKAADERIASGKSQGAAYEVLTTKGKGAVDISKASPEMRNKYEQAQAAVARVPKTKAVPREGPRAEIDLVEPGRRK